MKNRIDEHLSDSSEDGNDLNATSFYGKHSYSEMLSGSLKVDRQRSGSITVIEDDLTDSESSSAVSSSESPLEEPDKNSPRASLFWNKPASAESSVQVSSSREDSSVTLPHSFARHSCSNKRKSSSDSDEDCVVISRKVLFTYSSPFVDSNVDITEYDRVVFCAPFHL